MKQSPKAGMVGVNEPAGLSVSRRKEKKKMGIRFIFDIHIRLFAVNTLNKGCMIILSLCEIKQKAKTNSFFH